MRLILFLLSSCAHSVRAGPHSVRAGPKQLAAISTLEQPGLDIAHLKQIDAAMATIAADGFDMETLISASISTIAAGFDVNDIAERMTGVITDGDDLGPFDFQPAHLGPRAAILTPNYLNAEQSASAQSQGETIAASSGRLARELVQGQKNAASHMLTVSQMFHVDHLLARLEQKFQSCSDGIRKFEQGSGDSSALDCWTEAIASAGESRQLVMRKKKITNDAADVSLVDLTPDDLFYTTYTSEQPFICRRGPLRTDRPKIYTAAHIDSYSPFLFTMHDMYREYNVSRTPAAWLAANFNPASVWIATSTACLLKDPVETNLEYDGLLYAWARHRAPKLAEMVGSKFRTLAQKAQSSGNHRDLTLVMTYATPMLQALVESGKTSASTPTGLATFLEANADALLSKPELLFLWLASDGSSWRAQFTRKQLALLQLYQCFVFDEGQAFDAGADGLVAGGAMWCSDAPAKQMLSLEQEATIQGVVIQPSIAAIKADFMRRNIFFSALPTARTD